VRVAQRFTQVDAFTDRPFTGNPAAVCLLESPADPVWMQQVAREMNLAETAFLIRRDDGYDLRWFTPSIEVDLCGHATLASAHVLWEDQHLRPDETARFHTRSGLLTASREGSLIWLDFPATPSEPAESAGDLEHGLGTAIQYLGRTRFDYLVEVESETTLRGLAPDLTALSRLPVRGVIVTSRSERPEYDFVSRFFAPGAGVPEDPVTGSAHCGLAPFWGGRLGKTRLVGYQASERGGVVMVELVRDRVRLGGQAVTVLRGELLH
jgi:PhzF family phenazine biosynthesis protein